MRIASTPFIKKLDVKDIACDVLVVGGGLSGVSAALASARCGVNTVLVEKEAVLGGIGTLGMLQHICGLYLNSDVFPSETLNKGITDEIVTLLNKLLPQKKVKKIGKVFVLPYASFYLQYILSYLFRKESNLTVFLNTLVISLTVNKKTIHEALMYRSGSRRTLLPKVVIDCSGSGEISALAEASFTVSPSEKRQLAGYIVHFKGLCKQDESLSIKVPYCLNEAVGKNLIMPSLRFSHYTPGDAPDEGYCKFSVAGSDREEPLFRIQENVLTAHHYLASRLDAFKDSFIAGTSTGVIEREQRMILGEFTLSSSDVLGAKKFHDGIVKNSWPIEIWDRDKGTHYKYIPSSEYYEIPFRCLKVKDISNLLCAGRCISVTPEALASTRVMGTCIALGEQAGLGAANYIKKGTYCDTKK